MDLSHALDLLEIKQSEFITLSLENLKHRYHKLALQNHPDKNCNTIESKERFQFINEAYNVLKREISIINGDNCSSDSIPTTVNTGYLFILHLFIDSLLQGKYNDIISSMIKDIVSGTKKISFKLFENMDKERAVIIYNLLFKYKAILHIEQELLDEIQVIILEKYKDIQIYVLNPSITDLFENNIYKLELDNKLYFVPLWHNELYFDGKNGDIIVKCIPDLPENIIIDENNNLIITVRFSFTFSLLSENVKTISIGNKSFDVPIAELLCKRIQTYTFKKQGISKICEKDMYSIGDLSDIIIKIVFEDKS